MNTAKIYWCDHCGDYVEPTRHDVTDSRKFDGETTWEFFYEMRCSLCMRLTEECVACVTCKAQEPESGADECTRCIDTSEKVVTNKTPAYLRFHATVQHEPEYQEQAA
jgi:hypothetical protein